MTMIDPRAEEFAEPLRASVGKEIEVSVADVSRHIRGGGLPIPAEACSVSSEDGFSNKTVRFASRSMHVPLSAPERGA